MNPDVKHGWKLMFQSQSGGESLVLGIFHICLWHPIGEESFVETSYGDQTSQARRLMKGALITLA
jgi:hypothetical protein